MFVAFFESIKYVGHLIPIAFLRVFLGYFYLDSALKKFQSDFLYRPRLAADLAEILGNLQAPVWYRGWIENIFIPHWQTLAFALTACEFAIAVSYLVGYVVRPVALLGTVIAINQLALASPSQEPFARTLVAIHLTFAWIGAGRCLGFDYYFFKRRRGLWW
jgi:thiosulfate dehydrogenase (quinone) large subunit